MEIKLIKLEGTFKLNDNLLVNKETTLKLGIRHKPKKGQAKRFIGYIDPSKPEDDQYTYISSLYSRQGTQQYSLEYDKQPYTLAMTGVNSVVISKSVKEPVLVYKEPALAGKVE